MNSLLYIDECASTNDEILKYIDPAKNCILSLYTFNQTKGKGQYGNSWQSMENVNLALSIAIPEKLLNLQGHLFNFHTAVSVAEFLAIMTKANVEVKWPNDLIIKNKKVAGVLLEKKRIANVPYIIVGTGLNILQEKFENLPKAGSLWTQTGHQFQLKDFTTTLNSYLVKVLVADLSEFGVLEKFNKNLYRADQISVFDIKGLRQNGIIKKVDQEGFLWIDLENEGERKFAFKEIELLY